MAMASDGLRRLAKERCFKADSRHHHRAICSDSRRIRASSVFQPFAFRRQRGRAGAVCGPRTALRKTVPVNSIYIIFESLPESTVLSLGVVTRPLPLRPKRCVGASCRSFSSSLSRRASSVCGLPAARCNLDEVRFSILSSRDALQDEYSQTLLFCMCPVIAHGRLASTDGR